MGNQSINIIAEFCQNHLGDNDLLEQMVISAKKNGASHAKIQGLYSNEITKRIQFESENNTVYRPYEKEVARLQKLDLSFKVEKWFVKICREIGITPMITVFTHRGVERAKLAGFKSIKIASYDCGSKPIIRKVIAFAEELVISTGATYWQEVSNTVELINQLKLKDQKLALLHARTIYPTKISELGLLRMNALSVFGFKIGYSDHTKPEESHLFASKLAILLGAEYVERHFTILSRESTKDGPISITPMELLELKKFTEKSKEDQLLELASIDLLSALKCNSIEPTEAELINREYYRGRVASVHRGKHVYSWEELTK
jgi:sialic acid synthase SpsE